MRTHTIVESPIGELTLVNTDGVLSELKMRWQARGRRSAALGERASGGFEHVTQQLSEYFAGQRTRFTVETAASGDAWQHRVWELLKRIPYGETRSYGDLARELGNATFARAVGTANARNPLGIIVPCHRVIGSNGSLTGYAGGLENKRFLLDLEANASGRVTTLF